MCKVPNLFSNSLTVIDWNGFNGVSIRIKNILLLFNSISYFLKEVFCT